MSDSEPPSFSSIEDERDYWKDRAAQHQQRCYRKNIPTYPYFSIISDDVKHKLYCDYL